MTGSFGIPEGLYFSQPVYLKKLKDKSRLWSPCVEFPKPNIPSSIFQSLITTASAIIRKIDSKEPPFVLKTAESCVCHKTTSSDLPLRRRRSCENRKPQERNNIGSF